jgi:phosphate transport system protein
VSGIFFPDIVFVASIYSQERNYMLESRHTLVARKTEIEKDLVRLFSRVKNAMEQAIECLNVCDKDVCRAIVESDSKINQGQHQVEQDCLLAIALHQPVAHDLREIVAAGRIAGELERAGDYAADIAAIILQTDGSDLSKVGVAEVLELSHICVRMLDEVITAYLQKDAENAKRVARMDDEIDAGHERLVQKLFAAMQASPDLVPDGSRMLWISHILERCGDRATNIAEQVVFMLEAEVTELD